MTPPVVTLYGREGCHLCEAVLDELRRLESRLGFSIELIDIESDEDLTRRYLLEIPVVAVAGREIARAPIDSRSLPAILREALVSTRS